jgi:hypothetical protein
LKISHISLGFLPSGFQENSPILGPLKYFSWGYFWGIRIDPKLKISVFANHKIVSYLPENLFDACRP